MFVKAYQNFVSLDTSAAQSWGISWLWVQMRSCMSWRPWSYSLKGKKP